MPVPMVVQRCLVWAWTRTRDKQVVDGITLVGDPEFPSSSMQTHLRSALLTIAEAGKRHQRAVEDNIRLLVITDKLKNVLAPYGACFLPGDAPKWKDPRALAGWLVWCAAYVAASKTFKLTRQTTERAAAEASDARRRFFNDLDGADD